MSDVDRYETTVDEGVVFIENDERRLEVGPLDDIVDLVGGETYVLTYEVHRPFDWLATDDEGRLEIDVVETLHEMTFPPDFGAVLTEASSSTPHGASYPARAAVFAEFLTKIWERETESDES